jgi:hypothetical protein
MEMIAESSPFDGGMRDKLLPGNDKRKATRKADGLPHDIDNNLKFYESIT